MATSTSGKRRVLARGAVSRVDICGCEGVRLTIGAVTVRLPPGSFRDLFDTLDEAMQRLEFMTAREREPSRH